MNRDRLKALIVETLATTTTPAPASGVRSDGGVWGTKPWHRHKVEDGDGGHNFVGSCALCRWDIHGLAEALTDAIKAAEPVWRFDFCSTNRETWTTTICASDCMEGHTYRKPCQLANIEKERSES